MFRYFVKRLIALVPVIIGVMFIVFAIMELAPGDPARMILGQDALEEDVDELREEMGLNDPMLFRFGRYVVNLLKGDMGVSYKTNNSVWNEIIARMPSTFKLAVVSLIFCVITAIPLGIVAALRQNTIFDGFSMLLSLIGLSMPNFWLGLLLIIAFSINLGWFPSGGDDGILSIILPAFTLGFSSMASIARTTRSSMLEVIRQDYIRTARAKGVPKNVITVKHALRNAMIPTITIAGLQLGAMLGGSVLTETVFSWPGIGRFMVTSVNQRDLPVVLGCTLVYTVTFSIVNFMVDMIYAVIDPRVKSQYKAS